MSPLTYSDSARFADVHTPLTCANVATISELNDGCYAPMNSEKVQGYLKWSPQNAAACHASPSSKPYPRL